MFGIIISKYFIKGMYFMEKSLIFHVDVNSAFLSWEATYRMQQGETVDMRSIPSVIGGDEKSRHGVVLAKSIPAKNYGIKTGESLFSARMKCKNLIILPPNFNLYMKCSTAMFNILKEYTPNLEKFSIDECFLDFTGICSIEDDYIKLANDIKDKIKNELGFTINIGISTNKLLAKMASDFKKPDRVHTLFKNEIKDKMWPLPVENLFMVGRATLPKLNKINIYTIGDLANSNLEYIRSVFKSHGVMIWNFANGIENSKIIVRKESEFKSIGNSTTIPFDIHDRDTAHKVLLSLCDTVSMRLRNENKRCKLISVSIKNSNFVSYSHQRKLINSTDSTKKIVEAAYKLFDEIWKGDSIRHLGVYISEISSNEEYQISIFDDKDYEKNKAIDSAMDNIRTKYGFDSIVRSIFLRSEK